MCRIGDCQEAESQQVSYTPGMLNESYANLVYQTSLLAVCGGVNILHISCPGHDSAPRAKHQHLAYLVQNFRHRDWYVHGPFRSEIKLILSRCSFDPTAPVIHRLSISLHVEKSGRHPSHTDAVGHQVHHIALHPRRPDLQSPGFLHKLKLWCVPIK